MSKVCRPLPNLDFLFECFLVDQSSGFIFWKQRPLSHFVSQKAHATWNGKYPGKKPGTLYPSGYVGVTINRIRYYVHRITYYMATETDPMELEIDHIDRNKSNNSVSNLRIATSSQNHCNSSGATKRSKSGVRGVHWHGIGKKWTATVKVQGKSTHLGLFANLEDAKRVVKAERNKHYGEFAGGD